MICFPNAKINLGLNIVSKRSDGYHNLETVFYPLMIKDALEVIESKSDNDRFFESGISTGAVGNDNLVMKALGLLREKYSFPKLDVHLLKKIPFGAGIGGGSADAAFMLKLINRKFELGADNSVLADMAVRVGADCPFFIYNRPMFASGIGEVLEDVNVSLDTYKIILIKPDIHVSTKDAFSQIKPKHPEVSLKEIIRQPIGEWRNLMKNDFEDSIFPKYPEIEIIKHKLYELGALYSSMSGSGSSVYAIFDVLPEFESYFPNCYTWNYTNE